MKVSLIAHTFNPERIVSTAARLCYANMDIEEAVSDMNDDEAARRSA